MVELQLSDFSLSPDQEDFLYSGPYFSSIEYKISYISDFRSAKVLREITDILCKNSGMRAKWRTRIVLILDELHNNAIEYGSKLGDVNIFYMKIDIHTQDTCCIEASVTDTGKGQKAKKAADMEEIRRQHKDDDFSHHTSIRGRGLFLIISHLVDTLSFKDSSTGGLEVSFIKKLSFLED